MPLIKYLDRYRRIDNLIRQQKTGSPIEFAKKLKLSESHLYFYIRELKDLGLPIAYSRTRKTYFYKENIKLDIAIAIKNLSSNELVNVFGGFKKNCSELLYYFIIIASNFTFNF